MFEERHDHQYLLSLEPKMQVKANALDIVNNCFDVVDEEAETEKVVEE